MQFFKYYLICTWYMYRIIYEYTYNMYNLFGNTILEINFYLTIQT